MTVDYSLYLVTDSTPAILGSRDLVETVEAALKGGVTIVQYRDKDSDTADLVRMARRLHSLTRKYNVPLLINDRVDVALAIGCEGVHIGQDDMDLKSARCLLGDDAIIGVTVTSIEEARNACEDGADYLGVGTVYSTSTKKNTKSIIGTAGTKAILKVIADYPHVRTVCIGGVNEANVQRVIYQSNTEDKELDGVAVVSAIIGASNPKAAAHTLATLIGSSPPFVTPSSAPTAKDVSGILDLIPRIITEVDQQHPLSHNMTNLVVQNFAANIALAIGASPIMANYGEEASDLSRFGGALVLNMGTVNPEGLQNYQLALKAYNHVGGPIIFDPVGAGATATRRAAATFLLAEGYFDLIKGNEGEIKTIYGVADARQRGVDSGTSTLDAKGKAILVRDLAARERNVVVMTGVVDYVSDGKRTFAIANGHDYLSNVTGTGCVLGTTMSATLAVHRQDKLAAAIAAILAFEIAAEIAAERDDVKGPGTFVPALIDELYRLRQQTKENELEWISRARLEIVALD